MFQPVGDKILIRPINKNGGSSIIIPEPYKVPDTNAEVVRLGTYNLHTKSNGQKIRTQNWPVKPKDWITFNPAAGVGMEVEEDGETLLVIHIGQVLTVIER